jgi:tetratricopeptide (TPR) repeat protein
MSSQKIPKSGLETFSDKQNKRKQILSLNLFAMNCRSELQYAKAEKTYKEAAMLAEQLNDLSLMIKTRESLAFSQRIQGKYKEALSLYTWLIETAFSANSSYELTESDMSIIADGFMDFIEVGSHLPHMTVDKLDQVIDQGLRWLEHIGKKDWKGGFHLQRGLIRKKQNRQKDALEEMEIALACRRRYGGRPGYALSSYLIDSADLLSEMENSDKAKQYYQQIIEGSQFDSEDRQKAWRGLAQLAIQQQKYDEAENLAQKSVNLAREIESPRPMVNALNVLAEIYLLKGALDLAVNAKIQVWRYVRQYKEVCDLYELYRDFGKIRLQQARQSSPHQRIPKAQQWLQRAMPLALRLDRQVNSTDRQTLIRSLQEECAALLATENET